MIDIREKAKVYLMQVLTEIRSSGPTGALFTRLTGLTHSGLITAWQGGSKQTSCNSFSGLYATGIGIPKTGAHQILGFQRIDNEVKKTKPYAWIEASDSQNKGMRPQYGDIFLMSNLYHTAVSLDFEGDFWNTVEGGQGGPSTAGSPPNWSIAYDAIKRKKARQTGDVVVNAKGEKVKGWVDIDLFVNGLPQPVPMPPWLQGWWVVPWRGQLFYYYFELPGKVSWTLKRPPNEMVVPLHFDDVATVQVNSRDVVTIKWKTTGSVEVFKPLSADRRTLIGDWNDREPLYANRGLYYNPQTI